MAVRRSSGILLPVASLPGGRLDRDAFRFVDWLSAADQSWWEVLPLGPPDFTGLPTARPRRSPRETAWGSLADLAIAPVQDILGLGSEARVNHPGRSAGNWRWRVERRALTALLARRLASPTRRSGRAG